MKKAVLLIAVCMLACQSFAQTGEDKLSFDYPQKAAPHGIENYKFSTYYYNNKKTNNMMGLPMSKSGQVLFFRVNPTGKSFVIAEERGKKTNLVVYDLWKSNKVLKRIACKGYRPLTGCFAPDGRLMAVAQSDGNIRLYDARDYQAQQQFQVEGAVTKMEFSPDTRLLALATEQGVRVYDTQSQQQRAFLPQETKIHDLTFSADGEQMAVLTELGRMYTYGTTDFALQQTYDALGDARSCYYHPEGKYMAVVTGDKRIAIVNLKNLRERDYVENEAGGIDGLRFLKDTREETYLAYNTNSSIVYAYMNKLSPHYTRLLSDELNRRMEEWLKQRPDETLADYNRRVNDETRAEQMKLFEREITTELADALVDRSIVTLGGYDENSNLLAVNFNTMSNIYLEVPEDDIEDFADPGVLEFHNTVYGLTKEDNFELIYADVVNTKNGKTYTFDNLARKSLDYMESEGQFVPMDIIHETNQEELRLREIRNDILNTARSNSTLTDNTRIMVDTRVETSNKADGEKQRDYVVKFSYEVEEKFSAQEDFGPGRYKTAESKAALAMLAIVKKAFDSDFAKYFVEGKKLVMTITGMADATPIRKAIAYDGTYGEFTDAPLYQDDTLTSISVNRAGGIATNEQLAFLRAVGVKEHIVNEISDIHKMSTDYRYNIQVSKQAGSQFRRITVECKFVDAF